jgi:hypothetical protein
MVERDGSTESVELDEVTKKVLKHLEKEESKPLCEVIDVLAERLNMGVYEVAKAIYRLKEVDKVIILDPRPPRRFVGYLFSSRVVWFWLLALVVVITDLSIFAFPAVPPFIYLRYVFGSLFVLYLPGASLIELLYPKKEDLSQLERLALSIGLSLALVPLIGLVLNYTPWGIRLTPITASLTLLTLGLALGAAKRKHTYHLLIHGGLFKGEEVTHS